MKKEELIKFKDVKLNGKEKKLIDEAANASINYTTERNPDKPRGFMNLIIATEELAELQQAITKFLRGKEDKLNLIEELADVEICLEYIKKSTGVSKEDLEKMKRFKAERILRKVKEENFK